MIKTAVVGIGLFLALVGFVISQHEHFPLVEKVFCKSYSNAKSAFEEKKRGNFFEQKMIPGEMGFKEILKIVLNIKMLYVKVGEISEFSFRKSRLGMIESEIGLARCFRGDSTNLLCIHLVFKTKEEMEVNILESHLQHEIEKRYLKDVLFRLTSFTFFFALVVSLLAHFT